ncbi:hypothetical protein ACRRTK_021445 [Alexandromys fortis]
MKLKLLLPSSGASVNHPDIEGETPSWSLLDLYDGFTPFDKSDFYCTIYFCDNLEEEEEEEEDDKDAVGGRDLEDENDLLMPSQKPAPFIRHVIYRASSEPAELLLDDSITKYSCVFLKPYK